VTELSAIILAGGKSRRMGADKAFLPFKGKKLIEHVIDIATPHVSEILISANSSEYTKFGFQTVPDEIPGCGPLGGIYSSLKKSKFEWNLVLSCDTPFVSNGLLSKLIARNKNCDCIVPLHNEKKEPLVALYHKRCLAAIQENLESGNYKMHFLFEKLNCCFVDVFELVEENPQLFHNINSSEDMETGRVRE